MVWINEIPWNEMNVDDELTLRCEDAWAREIELRLRLLLYQWRHMPADMIVDDSIACPVIIHSTGFGLREDVDIVKTDDTNDVVSRHFHPHIVNPADIEKIKMPVVTHDREQTEQNYAAMCDIFGDILPVVKVGKKGTWFAPWDELIRWWGVQEAMRDLVDRPEMVEAAISRLVDCVPVRARPMGGAESAHAQRRQHPHRLGWLRPHERAARRLPSIPRTRTRATSGAARPPRSSAPSRRRCTGSSR